MPDEATSSRVACPIPLFGAGLVEAIPDDTLLALEDPCDRNGDGVSGRAAIVTDVATGERRVGRFGWKAQHATLLTFGADAYRNEMGITNEVFPQELAFGVTPIGCVCAIRCRIPRTCATVDRPPRHRQFRELHAFSRARRARPVDDRRATASESSMRSAAPRCHVPALTTGPSANPLFNRKPVPLFSDLLLHDVGTGDGIQQGAATPEEIRTPALWGLRLRRPLLHDGSVATIEGAIRRHQNEAEARPAGVRAVVGRRSAASAGVSGSL